MTDMHDWTLKSIILEWHEGRATVELVPLGPEATALLIAEGVTEFQLSRRNEWGPSVSVNQAIGPSPNKAGGYSFQIEMQSGDSIAISAARFTQPK